MAHPAAPGQLEQQVAALLADNARLSGELQLIREQNEAATKARGAVIRGGARLLIPMLDRNGVVRSFSSFVQILSGFAGPSAGWPQREEILDGGRNFAEACVRFAVRRRTSLLLFSLIATAIPVIQIYLVVQQNAIIQNQNEFFRIQVYDVVSRSMTEGNRNARLMTGALLANAEPEFLADVVAETFDPELVGVWGDQGKGASRRRLEDAAFRGYLAHAVGRSVERQLIAGEDLTPRTHEMVARVVQDAVDRVPQVIGIGGEPAPNEARSAELDEQVNNYLAQLGFVLRLHGQIARSADDSEAFFAAVRTLLQRLVKMRVAGNRFELAYRVALEEFLLDVGNETKLGAAMVAPTDPDAREAGRARGIEILRETLGQDALDWDALREQGTAR